VHRLEAEYFGLVRSLRRARRGRRWDAVLTAVEGALQANAIDDAEVRVALRLLAERAWFTRPVRRRIEARAVERDEEYFRIEATEAGRTPESMARFSEACALYALAFALRGAAKDAVYEALHSVKDPAGLIRALYAALDRAG
jgi:hypothetical protein